MEKKHPGRNTQGRGRSLQIRRGWRLKSSSLFDGVMRDHIFTTIPVNCGRKKKKKKAVRQPFSDALPAGKFLGMQRFNLGFIFARWHLQDEPRQSVLGEAVTLRRVFIFRGK